MRRRAFFSICVVVLMIVSFACGGGSGTKVSPSQSPSVSPSLSPSPSPSPTATPSPSPTPVTTPADWAKAYTSPNDDSCRAILQREDGGYIAAGNSWVLGEWYNRTRLISVSYAGEVEWQRAYDSGETNGCMSVCIKSDGGYIVAGYISESGDTNMWLLNLNNTGGIVWQKSYGGANNDIASSIIQDSDGNFVVLGYTTSFGSGGWDMVVMKLDGDGTILWQKVYGGTGAELGSQIKQTNNGDYIVAGYASSFGTGDNGDLWVVRLTNNGEILWQYAFDNSDSDYGNSIIEAPNGSFFICGETRRGGGTNNDFWVMKLASNGAVLWQKCYGDDQLEYGKSVSLKQDGTLLVTGDKRPVGEGPRNILGMRLDGDGNILWQKAFGGEKYDRCGSSIATYDGGFMIAGDTCSFSGGVQGFWLLKMNEDGNFVNSLLDLDAKVDLNGTPVEPYFVTPTLVESNDTNCTIFTSTASPVNASFTSSDTTANEVESQFWVKGQWPIPDSWVKTYGGSASDYSGNIIQLNDGSFVIGANTMSFNGPGAPVWFFKTDPAGNLIWQFTVGGQSFDSITAISPTQDGGFIGSAELYSASTFNFESVILKFDAFGNIVWQYNYGVSEPIKSIQQLPSGGYIAAGNTSRSGAGSSDGWVMKLDANGTVIWRKTYGGSGWDAVKSIQRTSDGGYILGLETESYGYGQTESPDIWVIKLDGDGAIEWQRTYGTTAWDNCAKVLQTPDGGYIIAGETGFDDNNGDIWLLKLTADGDVTWQKKYNPSIWDNCSDIVLTDEGGYIVAGYLYDGSTNVILLHLDGSGAIINEVSIGSTKNEESNTIIKTASGGIAVAGYTDTFGAGLADVWIITLKSNLSFGNTGSPWFADVRNTAVSDFSSVVMGTDITPGVQDVTPIQTYHVTTPTSATVQNLHP